MNFDLFSLRYRIVLGYFFRNGDVSEKREFLWNTTRLFVWTEKQGLGYSGGTNESRGQIWCRPAAEKQDIRETRVGTGFSPVGEWTTYRQSADRGKTFDHLRIAQEPQKDAS